MTINRKTVIAIFAALIVIYLLQTLLTSPDAATLTKYHLTSGQLKLLTLTITIPYLVIWLVALYGYLKLNDYTTAIRKGKDGRAFNLLNWGMLVLTLWLPITAIMDSAVTYVRHSSPDSVAMAVRFNNYLGIAILFGAFWLISVGSKKLLKTIRGRKYSWLEVATIVVFILLSLLYIYLVLNDPARRVPAHGSTLASYYLPDWLITSTIIIPTLFMWYVGLEATQKLYAYQQQVDGKLYRSAFQNIAIGIGFVVATSITLNYLQSLSTSFIGLSLSTILLIVYLLLIMISVGFIFIARGSRKLKLIEDL